MTVGLVWLVVLELFGSTIALIALFELEGSFAWRASAAGEDLPTATARVGVLASGSCASSPRPEC